MEYQFKRQLIFGAAVLALSGGIIFASYKLLTPKPTCFDGVKNQGEEQIDCGGSCQACKVTRLEDVKVLSSNSFLLKDGSYDAYAEIKNINLNYGSESLEYTFSFYNADKKLIEERAGKSYILANQTRYIIESNIKLSEPAMFTNFTVNQNISWQKQDVLGVDFPVFSQKYEPLPAGEGDFAKVTGVVNNKNEYDFGEVEVDAVLVDNDDKVFAVGKTQIDNLRFGENRAFSVFFHETIPSPANIYIKAGSNVFDSANTR